MVHSILTHHAAATVDDMLAFHQKLATDVRFCVGYGGLREEFEKISHPNKFYLDDPSLRGRIEDQNFFCWLKATYQWCLQSNIRASWVHFTENDHLPLSRSYWKELDELARWSNRDFLGKWCMNRNNTNEASYLRYREDPVLGKHLHAISIHRDKTTIWGALADGMLLRWEALEALCTVDLNIPCFTEILIPSSLHHMGYTLGDFDEFSTIYRSVRHRPEYKLDDVIDLCSQGVLCCHPFKNTDQLSELYNLVLHRQL